MIGESGRTPLWVACRHGHLGVVDALLRAGANKARESWCGVGHLTKEVCCSKSFFGTVGLQTGSAFKHRAQAATSYLLQNVAQREISPEFE